jgi:single-stranded DNA-binding protein
MLETAFTGTIGRGPELKTSAGGKQYCSVPVAVANGANTTWIRVAVFGDLAVEFAGNAKKGETVHVEGRLTIGTYQAKDGTERVSLDVAARFVRVAEIGRRRRSERQPRNANAANKPARAVASQARDDFHSDEMPF